VAENRVGQKHMYTAYVIFGRKITKYTVIYGVYIRFWLTLAGNGDIVALVRFCADLCVCVYVYVCGIVCEWLRIGLVRTIYIYIYIYIRCMYGIFGREITKDAVIFTMYMYGSGQPYK
jgi:hypothetical protein